MKTRRYRRFGDAAGLANLTDDKLASLEEQFKRLRARLAKQPPRE